MGLRLMIVRSLAVIVIILLSSAVYAQETPDVTPLDATVYQTVNVRSGPDTRYDIVGQLAKDADVLVDGRADEEGSWLRIIMPNDEFGWLPVYVLTIEGDTSDLPVIVEFEGQNGTTVTVHAYGLVNVRSGPSISSDIAGQLEIDTEAEAIARSNEGNDWLYIVSDEVEGWVAYFTVQVEGNPNQLPVRLPQTEGGDLVPPPAVVRTRFNTRLHTEPSLESPTTMIIPFNSEVAPLAQSADRRWLYIDYQGTNGWGAVGLFSIARAELALVPVYDQDFEPEPTGTPAN
jgi:uncharacterized protein YraI